MKQLTKLMASLSAHCPSHLSSSASLPPPPASPGGEGGKEGNGREGRGIGGPTSGGGKGGAGGGGGAGQGDELPTLMLMDDGMASLAESYIRLSSMDGLEV